MLQIFLTHASAYLSKTNFINNQKRLLKNNIKKDSKSKLEI